jgi:hypothetical protein
MLQLEAYSIEKVNGEKVLVSDAHDRVDGSNAARFAC